MQRGTTNGFLKPEEILKQITIGDNMSVADFGCGHGYFTISIAKIVNQGIVYALDVVKEALQSVESMAGLEGIKNIKTIRCNLEILGGSKLEDNSIDLIILDILSQSQKKSEIIQEAKRVLKEDGSIILIEWINGSSFSPKQGWFVSKEQVEQLMNKEGLTLDKELEMDNQHYGLVFKK
ncbi:MAG: class I SAM-dependent methyltransferase [bacterium]